MKHVLFIDWFCDGNFEAAMVLLESVLRIIFKELVNPIWLGQMWRGDSESRQDMLDIIFMLYFLRCRI